MKLNNPDIVYIEWVDSFTTAGWTPYTDELESPMHIHTVGWLIAENESSVVVSAHFGDNDHTHTPMNIPKRSIVARHPIESPTHDQNSV